MAAQNTIRVERIALTLNGSTQFYIGEEGHRAFIVKTLSGTWWLKLRWFYALGYVAWMPRDPDARPREKFPFPYMLSCVCQIISETSIDCSLRAPPEYKMLLQTCCGTNMYGLRSVFRAHTSFCCLVLVIVMLVSRRPRGKTYMTRVYNVSFIETHTRLLIQLSIFIVKFH